MLDELVGPADAHDRRRDMFVTEQFENRAAIAAHERVVFQRHRDIRSAAKEFVRCSVEWFCETRVDDGTIAAFGGELLGGFARQLLHVAQREERNLAPATPHPAPLPIRWGKGIGEG